MSDSDEAVAKNVREHDHRVEILDKLEHAWSLVPNIRLGELILYAMITGHSLDIGNDLQFATDEQIVKYAEEYAEHIYRLENYRLDNDSK